MGGKSVVLRRLRSIFGGGEPSTQEGSSPLYGIDPEERERIGTDRDPLRDFEAGMARNEAAERAVHDGDPVARRKKLGQIFQGATRKSASPDLDHHGPAGAHVL